MKNIFVWIPVLLVLTPVGFAQAPQRIEVGRNYESYSNAELRRRVFQLEQAVSVLQDQVFQLAMRNNNGNGGLAVQIGNASGNWTCHLQSFGKTHTATASTKASALAQVLKACSKASNAIHCKAEDATCGNQ